MALRITETFDGKVLEVAASDKLTRVDYEKFVPEADQAIKKHGKIRVLFDMRDFHGWETGALWEDIKFDIKHFNDLERVAMVGDKKWERWMAEFCKPFTTATVKYFDHAEDEQAKAWIEEWLRGSHPVDDVH